MSDKRRKHYLTGLEEELHNKTIFLDSFVEAMRTCSDDDVTYIIEVVQSGASTSEIQIEVTRILGRKGGFQLRE